jgi:carbon monoxide dehydrogenase subunit G
VRVAHSIPSALAPEAVGEALSGVPGRTLDLRAGAITVRFDCRFDVDRADDGVRVTGIGVAPGAGFTADVAVRGGDGSLEVDGEVLVSGKLAGLGQRELRFWAEQLLDDVLARR